MKIPYKLLLLVLLMPLLSAAQSNYRAGYIVNSKGDTVKGFIDYQAWDNNPTSISFKSAMTDPEKKTFSMGEMRAFSVDGIAAYKKFVCKISMDVTDSRHVVEGRDTSFRIDTVFLKVLQKGKNLALYAYTDNLKTRYYIGEAPGYLPTELVYRIYIDREATNIAGNTVNENTYQKQLFALANKYNALDEKMTGLLEDPFFAYRESDLLKIVSRINNISNAEFTAKYSGHSKVSIYAGSGVNVSNITSDASTSYSAAGGLGHISYMPAFAIGADLVPDPNGGRAEFRAELSVNPGQMEAKYTLTVEPKVPAEASYNQLMICFTPQAMYNLYNAPNFKFYIGIGYTLTYSSFSNAIFQAQNKSDQNAGFPQETYIFQTKNTAFLFKAGFRIHKNWEIYADYYTSQIQSFDAYFNFHTQESVIGVNYFFGQ
jgi:hypothetical protein